MCIDASYPTLMELGRVAVLQLHDVIHHHCHVSCSLTTFCMSSGLSHDLVEWVGSGAPVGEEQAQSHCLEDAGNDTNGDLIQGALLSDNLRDELQRVSKELSHNMIVKTYTWSS